MLRRINIWVDGRWHYMVLHKSTKKILAVSIQILLLQLETGSNSGPGIGA